MVINKSILYVSDVASLLGCSAQVIYHLIHSGILPAYKEGKSWRIPEKSITDYINSKMLYNAPRTWLTII